MWTIFFYFSKRIEKVLAELKVLRFSESITLLRKWDLLSLGGGLGVQF